MVLGVRTWSLVEFWLVVSHRPDCRWRPDGRCTLPPGGGAGALKAGAVLAPVLSLGHNIAFLFEPVWYPVGVS